MAVHASKETHRGIVFMWWECSSCSSWRTRGLAVPGPVSIRLCICHLPLTCPCKLYDCNYNYSIDINSLWWYNMMMIDHKTTHTHTHAETRRVTAHILLQSCAYVINYVITHVYIRRTLNVVKLLDNSTTTLSSSAWAGESASRVSGGCLDSPRWGDRWDLPNSHQDF